MSWAALAQNACLSPDKSPDSHPRISLYNVGKKFLKGLNIIFLYEKSLDDPSIKKKSTKLED